MTFSFRESLLLLGFIFALFCLAGAAAAEGRSTVHEVPVDGIMRSYRVYCPENCRSSTVPLMVVLHGGLGNALEIERRTGMDQVADDGHFVVVYPNGIEGRLADRRTWNAGKCCGPAAHRDIDDVGFIARVIEQVQLTHAIDSRRIYVAGMSNGGMMAYRLASAIPEKIAAVIAVSAALEVEAFDAARNVAVLHIHGTDDTFVPVAGGVGEKSLTHVAHPSLEDTVKLITRARGCALPEVQSIGSGVQSSVYRCSYGAPVEIVVIQGGKHAWPGGSGRRDEPDSRRNFSASRYAWEFARRFNRNNQ